MTTLITDQLEIPAADLGIENPMPHFRHAKPSAQVNVDDSVPQTDRSYLGWETTFRVLPYRMQDGYGRELRPRSFMAITLENEYLKAVVLPEMGGRLASLTHKPSGTELLEPVTRFQPANVALRNAWIAGGIEWNTPLMGHHYLTCGPVFAARVVGADGDPALRLYAWERVKRFAYQIDLHLPSGSELLFAHVRIVNPHDVEIPMYWWTNIAVPESPDRRVIAPADSVIHNVVGGLACAKLPMLGDKDLTCPTSIDRSREMFFRLDECAMPWVACVDGRGEGLIHASTARLCGRKMFVWGTGRGGRRWQEHLLGPGRAYLEIQGGLARTQLESVPMPAHAEWAWTEAFGLARVDPARAHSSDWAEARGAVEQALDGLLTSRQLEQRGMEFAKTACAAPDEMLSVGEGWGALEAMFEPASDSAAGLCFGSESIGEDQAQWLALLKEGRLPERDVLDEPGHYMIGPGWRKLLEESIARGDSDHWLGWLHLGVMRMEELDGEGARAAWNHSIERAANGWAYRNLAVLSEREGDLDSAVELMRQAWDVGPRIASLAIEFAGTLERAGKWDELRMLVDELPGAIRAHERILIAAAKLALHFDDLTDVEDILSHEFATIREGEVTLTDLWFAWQAKLASEREGVPVSEEFNARVRRELTPPLAIDMRMSS